jgi:hypothetical protein
MENALAGALPDDTGTVRLDAGDHLVIPKLTAEDIPAEARELKEELSGMLPFAPIASLLIELDGRTGFLDCFTHAGGRKLAHSPELRRNILAVLIALATNLGLARMSEACGISYDVLAWTMEWYVREETLREANTCVVNHHYGLELSKVFGGGTMSSSDGQRFPVRGKSLTGRDMVIHGGRVLSTYTHVSDQWSTYGTKIIVPTAREAHFALDEFLGNATDLPVTEHTTDTHGATLINFGLFDLVGKALTPRMRDLTKVTLVRDDTPTEIGKALPACRSAAGRPLERGPDQRLLAGFAADERVAEVRAGLSVADRREVVGRVPAEHHGGRAQGMGHAAQDHPYRAVLVGSRLPAADHPAAEQGRVAARAAPGPALRPAGHHHQAPPDRAD